MPNPVTLLGGDVGIPPPRLVLMDTVTRVFAVAVRDVVQANRAVDETVPTEPMRVGVIPMAYDPGVMVKSYVVTS